MKQGRWITSLVLAAMLATVALPAAQAVAAPRKSAAATATASPKKKSYAFRQFTGVVSALDASSLTVEKTGKQAKTMVFSRKDGMKTTGELVKDARVTVYWREDGGRPVAHKVVVKEAPLTATR
ncbi:MAG: hypothetical protein HZA61_03740 [Candidatus Eisenbacteria bacterium]|uniref:DUF5666 domain-containing protein n=1 Tax=Eiseniibacteriota bacterium TaxID=2212470 RepID=A0A933W121_UNCEI|nr:hypothetical protein [Candidatus Eisenbacteria bacterium]